MKVEAFKLWLQQQGAELLSPTNQYEVLRARARGRVHILYKDSRGAVTWPDFLRQCYANFERGARMDMGLAGKARTTDQRTRLALLERDGRDCFFCSTTMPDDDITIEHLVSLHKGGPNHMDNLVLAHRACNQKADNLPLVRKIRLREQLSEPLPVRIALCEICIHRVDREANTCLGCGHVVCVRHFPSEPQQLPVHTLEYHRGVWRS